MQRYPKYIVENDVAREDFAKYNDEDVLNDDIIRAAKNVLVCNVKPDNEKCFIEQSADKYYTGKRFPSTVELGKLYYFMPYIKRKGIRDLYLIKRARVGTRKEGLPDNDPTDFRLVFEIVFIKELFNDYQPIDLKIWRTFTDTTICNLLK